MPKHNIAPVPNEQYYVNGVLMIVRAVTNARYIEGVKSYPWNRWGSNVYLSRRYKNGRIAKSVMSFRNGANDPSWYEQDVETVNGGSETGDLTAMRAVRYPSPP